jgi:hypothetical protein
MGEADWGEGCIARLPFFDLRCDLRLGLRAKNQSGFLRVQLLRRGWRTWDAKQIVAIPTKMACCGTYRPSAQTLHSSRTADAGIFLPQQV